MYTMTRLQQTIDSIWDVCYYHSFGIGKRADLVSRCSAAEAVEIEVTASELSTLSGVSRQPLVTGGTSFVGVSYVAVYKQPAVSFDTIAAKLPYGQIVTIKKMSGRWAQVATQTISGWVLKDVLCSDPASVLPQFQINTTYTHAAKETQQLRAYIRDEFGGGHADLPLTDAEYVSYRLQQQGVAIDWDAHKNPRTPGTWQRQLRGRSGIHIAITPSVGCIMEYILDDVGFVAYVEEVFADESIKVSQVGRSDSGQYTEYMMPKEEYREIKPVFITVVA